MINIASIEKARLIARAAGDKKGEDIVIMDMTGQSGICDWFVLVSAGSSRRIKAISDEVQKRLGERKVFPINVEGKGGLNWVLLDYVDVVVHIFSQDVREFYGLERLWSDAPRESVE